MTIKHSDGRRRWCCRDRRFELPDGGCVLAFVGVHPDGATQVEVAEAFGVTKQYVQQIEEGALAKIRGSKERPVISNRHAPGASVDEWSEHPEQPNDEWTPRTEDEILECHTIWSAYERRSAMSDMRPSVLLEGEREAVE